MKTQTKKWTSLVALVLLLLFAAVADGIADALGVGGFLIVGAIVLTVSIVLIRWSEVHR